MERKTRETLGSAKASADVQSPARNSRGSARPDPPAKHRFRRQGHVLRAIQPSKSSPSAYFAFKRQTARWVAPQVMKDILENLEERRARPASVAVRKAARGPAQERQVTALDRGIELLLRPRVVRRVRHVRAAPLPPISAWRSRRFSGDGVVNRLGHRPTPHRLPVLEGLHGIRRLALGSARGQDGQGEDMALKMRAPIIASSTPAAPASRRAWPRSRRYGEVLPPQLMASGVIPQISVIMGRAAGGDVYYAGHDRLSSMCATRATCSSPARTW